MWDLILLGIAALFIVLGIIVIVVIIGSLLLFLPAVVIAFVVWLLTGSFFWGAVAFLIISVLMILFKH